MLGSDFFRALPMRQRAPVMYPEISHPASVTFFVSDIVKLDSVGAVDDRPTDTKKTGRKKDLKKDCVPVSDTPHGVWAYLLPLTESPFLTLSHGGT